MHSVCTYLRSWSGVRTGADIQPVQDNAGRAGGLLAPGRLPL